MQPKLWWTLNTSVRTGMKEDTTTGHTTSIFSPESVQTPFGYFSAHWVKTRAMPFDSSAYFFISVRKKSQPHGIARNSNFHCKLKHLAQIWGVSIFSMLVSYLSFSPQLASLGVGRCAQSHSRRNEGEKKAFLDWTCSGLPLLSWGIAKYSKPTFSSNGLLLWLLQWSPLGNIDFSTHNKNY